MILRRFIQHVREQNWFAVSIDVVVVIVGIYLGFQVTEWGNQQTAREEEQQILRTLSLEVEGALARKLAERAENEEELEEIFEAVDYLSGELGVQILSEVACRRIAVSAGNNWRIVRLNTADEIVASGKLNLIGNEQVRLLIMEYRSILEEHTFRIGTNNQYTTPIPSKYPQLVTVKRVRTPTLTIGNMTFECDGPKMRENIGFQNDFRLNTMRHSLAGLRSDEEIEVLERLKAALDAEIYKGEGP